MNHAPTDARSTAQQTRRRAGFGMAWGMTLGLGLLAGAALCHAGTETNATQTQAATAVHAISANDHAGQPIDPSWVPGAVLSVYDIGHEMTRLHEPAADQAPSFVQRIEHIDLGKKAFGGLQKQFVAEIKTHLNATAAGAHTLRLESDDGAAIWVDGKLLVLDVGLHAMRPRDAKLHLQPGCHELRILMFQNVGDHGLKLSWRTPDTDGFKPVPVTAMFSDETLPQAEAGTKTLGDAVGDK